MGRELDGAESGGKGFVSPQASTEDLESRSAVIGVQFGACLLSTEKPELNLLTSGQSRQEWAEQVARELSAQTIDGKLKPEMAEALKAAGVSISEKDYVPDKSMAPYFKKLEGLKATTVTVDMQNIDGVPCAGSGASKVEMTIQPRPNGNEVKIKPAEIRPGAALPSEIEVVFFEDNQLKSTTSINADGSSEYLQFNIGSETLQLRRTLGASGQQEKATWYEGSKPRGREQIAEEITYRKGERDKVQFKDGVPSEKFIVSSENSLLGYRAYNSRGEELSKWHHKSLSGYSYYKSRDAANSLNDKGESAIQDLRLLLLNFRLRTGL